MRLRSISLRGLLRFTSGQPVAIDLDALGGGLVAITGENGAGKTTVVEAVPAALYKALPSRDSWYEYFHGRDAFVETVFDDRGHEVKVRVQVDAERRSTERYVFVDGQSATTGRGKEADAEVLRRFGSYELFLASVLGSQKRTGNFLDAAKGERKARFVELLGLAHLERLHEQAKDQRATAEVALTAARNALGALQAQAALLPGLEAAAAEARSKADVAAHKLEAARTEETVAVSALERAKGAQDRLASLEGAVRAAERTVGDARAALVAACQEEPRARRAAEQRLAALALLDPDTLIDHALERYTAAATAIDRRREDLEAALRERPALEGARKKAAKLGEEAAALQAAERAHLGAQGTLRLAEAAVAAAERRVKDAEARLLEEQRRLANEAALLERVPCTAARTWEGKAFERVDLAGKCQLLGAARKAKEAASTLAVDPALLRALEEAKEAAGRAHAAAGEALASTDAIRLEEIRAALPELQAQAGRLPALEEARTKLQVLVTELEAANAEKSKAIKEADRQRVEREAERKSVGEDLQAALAAARGAVTAAQERLDASTAGLDAAREALAAARASNDALSISQAEASLSTARATRYEAERAMRTADQDLATATTKADQLRERLAELPGLEVAARAAEQEVGDWTLLAQALGRDGIQAMEISAAGPEVARLCNALLEVWPGGPRWSIALETLREKKSARGEYSETFDIRAFDRGQERAVEGISGGERVIVGEALALALAIYNARKSGVQWRTLFRDETSGALSLANATAYADMLRRALALGGFHQVVFISHQPEVIERADVRLVVADGRVTVEGATAGAPAEAVA